MTTLVVLIVIGLNFVLLTGPSSSSSAGRWIARHVLNRPDATIDPHVDLAPTMYAVRDGDIRLIDEGVSSWDELSKLIQDRPNDVLMLAAYHAVIRRGFWAPTSFTECEGVGVKPLGTVSEQAIADKAFARAARALYVDTIQKAGNPWTPEKAARLRTTDTERSGVLGSGVLLNGAMIGALILFVPSLGWLPRASAYLASTRRQRRLARGRCPHCNYSIIGLPEPFCPECGKSWDLTAEDDLPPRGPSPQE